MHRLMAIMAGLLLLAGATPALAQDAPASGQVLNLAASAQVPGERFSLLDLAAPGQDLPAALSRRLAQVPVGQTPPLGRGLTVPGSRLRVLLRQANLGPGVSVLIPEQVSVERQSQRLSSAELNQIYIKAVNERLAQRPTLAEADIHDVDTGQEVALPAGQLKVQARVVGPTGVENTGRVPVTVEFFVDGRKEAQIRMIGSVDLYGQVVVSAHQLLSGHLLEPEDLEMRRVNLAEAGPGAVSDPAMILGYRTRVPMTAGAPLDFRRLEQTPLVRAGDVVTMIFSAEGIRVTAKGKADQSGFLNSRIRLTNMVSKREVWGRVLDAGTVAVD